MTDASPPTFLETGPHGAAWRLVLAHGAGAPMDSPFMEGMACRLAERGIAVSRFEFPYMAARRETGRKKPPDRPPVLLDSWRAAVEGVRRNHPKARLAIGGKSMGGRVATLLAAEGETAGGIKAVVTLGYPFHPPGKPDRLRVDHFSTLTVPTLMIQGTRDPFGRADEVATYVLPSRASVHWVEDGDHDLKPRKASGRTHAEALDESADAVAAFLDQIDSASR
jgi:predicted alpha/beta-hydrolase family hydrolase